MPQRLIDISLPVQPGMVVWPDSIGVKTVWNLRLDRGELSNLSELHTDVHAGTHVESALHFIENGESIDQVPLDAFIGPVQVLSLPSASVIDARTLETADLAPGTTRVIFKTRNSDLWAAGVKEFRKDFVGVNLSGARWLVDHGIRLVGNDYLSVAIFTESAETHQILLRGKAVIVEGLNLTNVEPGLYRLVCLPLRLIGTEAAQARVVLEPPS